MTAVDCRCTTESPMPKTAAPLPVLHHRDHTSSGSFVRVWKEGWAGDQFEVLHREDFDSMRSLFAGVVEFVEHLDED